MRLGSQLTLAASAVFFVALVGVEAIHLRSAQQHLQDRLQATAQEAATSIGLSLGSLMRGVDPALVRTVLNPAFDRGHYERIEYFSPAGERLVARGLPPETGDYPSWFVRLFPLTAPAAESLVQSGWRQLGRVRVTAHPRFAYEQLWATARNTVLYLLLIYAAALLALRLFLRGVLRPLAAVERAAQAISARNFVRLDVQTSTRELARVVQAMNALSGKVNEAIDAETRRAERLQAAAYRDPVTGVLNAAGFAARFESAYGAEHAPFSGTLAMLEIADLAAINGALGQERCNELLRALYRMLQDLAGSAGGYAGRWTGALAILALPGVAPATALERLAHLRFRAQLLLQEFGVERARRIYCGAVESPGVAAPLEALARSAEEAILQSREAAEGLAFLSVDSSREAVAAGEDPAVVVREALAARRLQLVGQVAYRMSDHRPLHTEVFARLRDASGSELAAARFLPIVAAHGLVEELDRAVIELVAARLRAGEGLVSVNVSMRSIERTAFVDWLAQRLERERGLASRLVFEVAEHGVIRNEAAAAAFAGALKAAGAAFAIDHFGVHPGSLALIPRLRPAYIKLAGAHTPQMVREAGARFFAESLVRAARHLDTPVIAQQVEDDATFQALGALGFAGYQGNLIGPPSRWS